eukprot:COSAG01_NODE_5267_length_4372_cov_534.525860_1_plen_310_part_00
MTCWRLASPRTSLGARCGSSRPCSRWRLGPVPTRTPPRAHMVAWPAFTTMPCLQPQWRRRRYRRPGSARFAERGRRTRSCRTAARRAPRERPPLAGRRAASVHQHSSIMPPLLLPSRDPSRGSWAHHRRVAPRLCRRWPCAPTVTRNPPTQAILSARKDARRLPSPPLVPRRRRFSLVSHLCACIGSLCLRQCVHGASIGGGALQMQMQMQMQQQQQQPFFAAAAAAAAYPPAVGVAAAGCGVPASATTYPPAAYVAPVAAGGGFAGQPAVPVVHPLAWPHAVATVAPQPTAATCCERTVSILESVHAG